MENIVELGFFDWSLGDFDWEMLEVEKNSENVDSFNSSFRHEVDMKGFEKWVLDMEHDSSNHS